MKLNNNDDSHNSGLNLLIYNMLLDIESHPTWVCGLKQFWGLLFFFIFRHTLRGCVDWNITDQFLHFSTDVTPYVGVWIETESQFAKMIGSKCHTLRGCVDWNQLLLWHSRRTSGHTLRGCVDWNRHCLTMTWDNAVTPYVGVWIETS